MFGWLTRRIEFHKKSVRIVWLIAMAIWTMFSNAVTVRDNFLSPIWQQRLATLNLLPKWQWYIWVIGLLILTLLAVIEGSYRSAQSAPLQDKVGGPHHPSISGELLSFFWSKAKGVRSSSFWVKLRLVNHEDLPCTIDRFWLTLTIGGHERCCLGYPAKDGILLWLSPPNNTPSKMEVYPLAINHDTPLRKAIAREGWVMFHVIESDMPTTALPFWLLQDIRMVVVDSLGNEHPVGHSSVTVFPATMEEPPMRRPDIEGQIFQIFVHGKAMYADEIRDVFKLIKKDDEFAIDVDILIEMYAVNRTNDKQFIRDFDFTAEIDGKTFPLILQRDFYAFELNGIDYEYCLNLSSNKIDKSKLETLRPLYQSLPVELDARKPLEGWLHFVVKEADPEKFKNPNYKFLIIDSLDNQHQILKSVMNEREGEITIRPVVMLHS